MEFLKHMRKHNTYLEHNITRMMVHYVKQMYKMHKTYNNYMVYNKSELYNGCTMYECNDVSSMQLCDVMLCFINNSVF